MAKNKGTHFPEDHTRQQFPETKGRTVEIVELVVENDYYGISIRFQDKTALTFSIEPCVVAFPRYADWTDEEEKLLKRYQPIRSEISSD